LIAIGILYLGVKSPTAILGLFGLDIGAGKMAAQLGQMAEPLTEGLGTLRERYGTMGGLKERRAEETTRQAYERAEGMSPGRMRMRRLGRMLIPGAAKQQDVKREAADMKRRAGAEERGTRAKMFEEKIAEARDKRNIIKPIGDAGVSAFYQGDLGMGVEDRYGQEVIGGLNLGDVMKHRKDGEMVPYDEHEEFVLDTLTGKKAPDYDKVVARRVDEWVEIAAQKRVDQGVDPNLAAAKQRIEQEIEKWSGADKMKRLSPKQRKDFARRKVYEEIKTAVINHGVDVKSGAAPAKQLLREQRAARLEQVSRAGAAIPPGMEEGEGGGEGEGGEAPPRRG
jgi:hypothetical protein